MNFPTAQEQFNGFYIYYRNNHKDFVRLLDKNLNHLLNRDFKTIILNKQHNIFFCFSEKETIVFDVNHSKKIEINSSLREILIDEFGNKFYNTKEEIFYGLLDDDFQIVTKPIIPYYLKSLNEKYILAYKYSIKHNNNNSISYTNTGICSIINKKGEFVLEDILSAEYCFHSKKYLIRKQNNSYVLLNDEFEFEKELVYSNIKLASIHSKIKNAKNFIAYNELSECYLGSTIKKTISTILDADGNELFKPCYDKVELLWYTQNNLFLATIGDIKHLELIGDDIENFNGQWDKDIFVGIIDEYNNIIVPVKYSSVSILSNNYFLVRKNAKYKFEYDETSYEEPIWDYYLEGGLWGVINKEGTIIINEEYDSISYEIYVNNLEAFRATKSELSEPIYFDMNGNKINVV